MTPDPHDEPERPAEPDPFRAKVLDGFRRFKATGLASWMEYQALCAMGDVAVECLIQAETERQDELARLVAGYTAWVTGGNPELLGELIGEAGGSLAMDIAALMATRRAVRRGK